MNSRQDDIQVTRSSMPPFDEYVAEIAPLWDSHWLTNMGVKHRELEAALCEYLDVDDIALFANGHQALECVLEALELGSETVNGKCCLPKTADKGCCSSDGVFGSRHQNKKRNKVITTPFTFASTTHAIVRKGLVPVFADIKLDDYTIDPASIERLMSDEVCAIVPVHVYGNLCDVDAISAIAARYDCKVIYDAAHSFGVKRDGVAAASFGDASMFSFHATKVFNTIEGGAVVFKDPALKEKLNQWKNFGITGPETCEYVGGNAKMNEFQAAMGICNLRHVDEEIAKRGLVARRYRELLDGVPGVKLCGCQENATQVARQVGTQGVTPNYSYFPVLIDENEFGTTRDEVFETLAVQGIHVRKYFYPLTSEYACYAGQFDPSETPNAQYVSRRILTLPMYADLEFEDVDRVCEAVLQCRR